MIVYIVSVIRVRKERADSKFSFRYPEWVAFFYECVINYFSSPTGALILKIGTIPLRLTSLCQTVVLMVSSSKNAKRDRPLLL